VPIGSRVAGVVAHIVARDDAPVRKGDVLFELDPADFRAKVDQAQAEWEAASAQAAAADAQAKVVEASARGGLSSARAAMAGSSRGVGGAEAQIAAAKAMLQRAETDERRAALDLQRTTQLRAANVVAQEKLDNAQLVADSARAAVELARAQLGAATEGREVAESKVGEARGRLDQSAPIHFQIAVARANASLAHAREKGAAASLAYARLQESYTRITAPADGRVSKIGAREGQLVQPGTPLAVLVPETTYLVGNYKETQVGRMQAGDRVDVTVDAFPGRRFDGVVTSLSGGTGARFSLLPPDNASGNYVKVVQRVPVRIAWGAPPGVPMRAGLSAEVTVHVTR
jgi:membrane fusion protein (multidrug efflux system)